VHCLISEVCVDYALCPEQVSATREFRVKLLVSILVNVNFTETFVIPTQLCTVQSVCSLTKGVTTGSKRQQFESPVVVLLTERDMFTWLCVHPYVLECHLSRTMALRGFRHGGTYEKRFHILCSSYGRRYL
jgi:hypothetical protein